MFGKMVKYLKNVLFSSGYFTKHLTYNCKCIWHTFVAQEVYKKENEGILLTTVKQADSDDTADLLRDKNRSHEISRVK